MKIAVIGSGISGLLSAYLLAKKHEVHLFEAADYLGGHTHTVDIKALSGVYAIDTGFIVFNDRTYPNFIKLLHRLDIKSKPTPMSFSVKVEKSGLEYNGTDLNRLFAQRSNLLRPSFYKMILEIMRFNKESLALLEGPDDGPHAKLTLGHYLAQNRFSEEFIENYIVPMGAAIWSASVVQMRDFPARYFVHFFKNHGFLSVNDRPQWRTISGGSRSYIPSLIQPLEGKVHLSSPVLAVRRQDQKSILTIGPKQHQTEAVFEQVIFATHSDITMRILADATPLEQEILSAFKYQENETLLHTDTSLLPKTKTAWASWNYWVPENHRSRVPVTYDMNILQGIESPETFCVSLNMTDRISPAKIIQKFSYDHPVYTVEAVAAQKRWNEISGKNLAHFCGAYWGFGFHEDGVKSALRVTESFGEYL